MLDRAQVRTPLLRGAVGTRESDFRIYENLEPPAPRKSPAWIAPLHRHRFEDEGWYVLEGTLRFRFGEEEFDAPAGAGVLLLHGFPHTFRNAGPAPARYLLIARTKTVALLDQLHGDPPPSERSVSDLFRRYDVDLLE